MKYGLIYGVAFFIALNPLVYATESETATTTPAATVETKEVKPAKETKNIVYVDVKEFKFTPQRVEIKKGTTVIWRNQEKRQYHSVWFQALGEPIPEYFFPEETYERTFNEVGEFPYICEPHPQMTGVIHVSP